MRYGPGTQRIQRSSRPVSLTLSALSLRHGGSPNPLKSSLCPAALRQRLALFFKFLFIGLFAALVMKFVSQAGVHFCCSTINAIIHYPPESHPLSRPQGSMVISAVERSGNCRHPSAADIVRRSKGGGAFGPQIRICNSNFQLGHLAKTGTE